MKDIEKAIKFAEEAHRGQVDKIGRPYLEHIIRVVASVLINYPDDSRIHIVAALHDVVEDTEYNIDSITSEFGYDIGADVWAITRDVDWISGPREPYQEYVIRCCKQKASCIVKYYDMKDNISCLHKIKDSETQQRLKTKYEFALPYVEKRMREYEDE